MLLLTDIRETDVDTSDERTWRQNERVQEEEDEAAKERII